MHAGVDEAGRGPVLGPLIVAGVHGGPEHVPPGVTDSKHLTPSARAALHQAILEEPELTVHTHPISAARIDANARTGGSLNELELDAFATVLDALDARSAIVDAIGKDTTAGQGAIRKRMAGICQVEMRIRAETSDPLVAAASIVAKVTRDQALDALAHELGEPVGSGYPSDPTTIGFLEAWRARCETPPPGLRLTWATAKRLGFHDRSLATFTGPTPQRSSPSSTPLAGGDP